MTKRQILINKLDSAIYNVLAEAICKKENSEDTEAYKKGLITAYELVTIKLNLNN
jgi:hypothetical protein